MSYSYYESGNISPQSIRPWVILIVAVLLIIAGFIERLPATLMLGCSMLGYEPIYTAGKEPAPK